MTNITSDLISSERWYKRIAAELHRCLKLSKKIDFRIWWRSQENLTPAQKLTKFVECIVLVLIPNKIFIFIDEVDSLLNINFPLDDFFEAIRYCYVSRSENNQYNRITFALFGVVKPSALVSNGKPTPFNIGRAIELNGFQLNEAMTLIDGFKDKVNNPKKVLEEILIWTGGQPFLTQKLCQIISNTNFLFPENFDARLISEWVKILVKKHIIENWETQDEPVHLRTIRDRILKSNGETIALLQLYQQILQSPVVFNGSPEQIELLLSGLVKKQDGYLRVYNLIYQAIFDLNWVKQQLLKLKLKYL
jgi:hypothetical protein